MNSQRIIIAVAVLVTVSTIAIIFLTFENNIAQQKQAEKLLARVHVFIDNGTKYVKINDFQPNSAVGFVYPYTENSSTEINNDWILIRLPSKYGGDKDDISSFRAYSARDIGLGCMLYYRVPSEKLVDACHDDTFEPVNGIAVTGNARENKYNALPNLDLGVDEDGYIFVKTPTFDFDKNGVIGAGRILTNDSKR